MQSQRIIFPDNFNINLLRKFHTNLSLHLEDRIQDDLKETASLHYVIASGMDYKEHIIQ